MAPERSADDHHWRDRLEIHETIYRYTDALNRADWDDLEAVFAFDAVWEMTEPTTRRYETAPGIASGLAGLLADVDMLFQTAHNPVVTQLGGDRASARCAVREMVGQTGGAEFVIFGLYTDELVRLTDGWCFAHRHFRGVYVDRSPLPGRVLLGRDELA